MEVEDYNTAVSEHNATVSRILEQASTLEDVRKMLPPMQHFQGTTVTLDEGSLNVLVTEKITAAAKGLGYTVATNRSAVITNRYSRFATSKPDLYMYSPDHHCGFVVDNAKEDYLEGVVSENKLPSSNPLAQMLGNMEKLAVDLLFFHLRRCSRDIRYIKIYGMIINYDTNRSTAYLLTIDFESKSCTLEEERQPLGIEFGLNRLLSQMEISTKTTHCALDD